MVGDDRGDWGWLHVLVKPFNDYELKYQVVRYLRRFPCLLF